MFQWDQCPWAVSPAADLLARCVSVGVLSQEELDSASSSRGPAFSSQLQERERHVRLQRRLDEVHLKGALLREDQQSADVSHSFHLTGRFQLLQVFSEHLQEVLRDHKSLRQRLMRPLTRTNLPVPAHLHRSVVDTWDLVLDFIQTLEEQLEAARGQTFTRPQLVLMNSALDKLLARAAELESVTDRLLQRDASSLAAVTSAV